MKYVKLLTVVLSAIIQMPVGACSSSPTENSVDTYVDTYVDTSVDTSVDTYVDTSVDTSSSTYVDTSTSAAAVCVPQCESKECGDDGCGSTCGTGCGDGYSCNYSTGLCYQAHGTLVWAKKAGSPEIETGSSISADSNGLICVAGGIRGNVTMGEGEANETMLELKTSEGLLTQTGDMYVAQYNTDGTLRWARNAPRANVSKTVATDDGSCVVIGHFKGTTTFGGGNTAPDVELSAPPSTNSIQFNEIYVVQYDSLGDLVWAKRAGGNRGDEIADIGFLSDGSFVVTGSFGSNATFGEGEQNQTNLEPKGDSDLFFAKYNSNGTLEWAKALGADGSDWGKSISVLPNDSVVVSGSFNGTVDFGGAGVTQQILSSVGDNTDVFIGLWDNTGSNVWVTHIGGDSFDFVDSTSIFDDGSLIALGQTNSDFIRFGINSSSEKEVARNAKIGALSERFTVKIDISTGSILWAQNGGGNELTSGVPLFTLPDNSYLVTGGLYQPAVIGFEEANQAILSGGIFISEHSSDGTLNWAKSIGGILMSGQYSLPDTGKSISMTSNSEFLVTGYFRESIMFGAGEPNETTLTSVGNSDFFIAKFKL